MELLFLSPCVPNPPDRRDRIRAFHQLTRLANRHRVHLSCFAQSEQEIGHARALLDRCASVYTAPLFPFPLHAARAAGRFLAGESFHDALYFSARFRSDLLGLIGSRPIGGAVAGAPAMAPFVPAGMPFVLDLPERGSAYWMARARRDKPRFLFQTEAKRLALLEVREARRASLALAASPQIRAELLDRAPDVRCETAENGVDFDSFDPSASPRDARLAARRYLLFCGRLDCRDNQRGILDFARNVFPALAARDPGLELIIIGRHPPPSILALNAIPGVEVAGTVEDVRPYYRHAAATVAPLPVVRGVPNKVLESLAMNRPVLASPEVCDAFGSELPEGVFRCSSAEDYARPPAEGHFRRAAMGRFSWKKNLAVLERAVAALGKSQ